MQSKEFIAYCRKKRPDISDRTIENYEGALRLLGEYALRAGKDNADLLTEDEIQCFIENTWHEVKKKGVKRGKRTEIVEGKRKATSYNFYVTIMKMYFGFLRKAYIKKVKKEGRQITREELAQFPYLDEEFLGEIGIIQKNPDGNKITDLKPLEITQEHVQWLIDACLNNRDKAVFRILATFGFRKGELNSIKVKDIQFGESGVYLNFAKGKTGTREVFAEGADAEIAGWLGSHPCRNQADFMEKQFICNLDGSEMKGKHALEAVFNQVQRRARVIHPTIPKVHPHLLRHLAATQAAISRMSDGSMKKYFGWKPASTMPSRYAHLTDKTASDEYKAIHGIKVEKPSELDKNKPKQCPRCHVNSASTAAFCIVCGWKLDSPFTPRIVDMDAVKEQASEINQMKAQMAAMMQLMQGQLVSPQDLTGIINAAPVGFKQDFPLKQGQKVDGKDVSMVTLVKPEKELSNEEKQHISEKYMKPTKKPAKQPAKKPA